MEGTIFVELRNQNILFFSRTMSLGGTENVILQLCKILQPNVKKIVVCSCGGVHVKKLEEMGISHYIVPDIEKKDPLTMFQVIRTLSSIMRKEQIHVIHTHHRMAAFYAALLSRVFRFKFINTSHNTFTNKKTFTRFAFQRANLVACGEMVKRNLVEYYGICEERVTVLHNAVEPFDDHVELIDTLVDLKEKGFMLIGNVGRLSKQKGMGYFIDAFPKVRENYPKAKFIIVGDGEERRNLEEQVKKLRAEDDIFFLGYRNDIQNVIKQMDLIVLSSLWEGLPLVPIEAFSVGKPVVATAVDGSVEIIRDGTNGFLVEPRNSDAIADKVICLLRDEDMRKRMGEAAQECYEKEFAFDSFSDRYINYYNEMLK